MGDPTRGGTRQTNDENPLLSSNQPTIIYGMDKNAPKQKASSGGAPRLRIIPLGGLGEIGKNMTIFEYGKDAIIVDTGIMFPTADMLGVDYIIPDIRYILERRDLKIHGILYTHGHEDHIGACGDVVEQLRGVPLYATPLTAGLLEVRLREDKLMDQTRLNVFNAGDRLKVGPFLVDSFHVCHSIPDCVGFGIHTPHGIIVHTGDYKLDNTPTDGRKTDYAKISELSRQGVLLLMADSTNADKAGWTPSERIVEAAFDKVFQNAKGRIMVATFASHISRIQQVAQTAMRHGRKLAFAGHSMSENVKMARKIGILNLPDDLLIDVTRMNHLQPHEVVIMVTGSQGEPTAVLGRLARGDHRLLEVRDGDTIVLSSHPIPGNEEVVSRTINQLLRRGADVIYDPIADVHVSGHGRQEEMRMMINLVNPRFFLPVHGELRHLREHAKIAQQCGIPSENIRVIENGMVLEIDKHSMRVNERVPGTYIFVDSSGNSDIGTSMIKDREVLARDGFVLVNVNVDSRSGRMVGLPEIISRGFVYMKDADGLLEMVRDVVEQTLISTPGQNGKRREKLQDNLSRVLFNETRRRPMVFSVINEV
jgi:ribonuclease J